MDFPNYKTVITKLIDVIDSLYPSKKVRIKGNTKPWFDSEVISIVNKRDACYKQVKSSGLENILRATKQFLKTTIQKQKRMFFQHNLQKNSKSSNEFWMTLKSLGINSKKEGQSKICLREDDVIEFQPKNANIFKTFYSELAVNLVKKLPKASLKFNSEKTKMFYKKLKPNIEKFELLCITEDITNK